MLTGGPGRKIGASFLGGVHHEFSRSHDIAADGIDDCLPARTSHCVAFPEQAETVEITISGSAALRWVRQPRRCVNVGLPGMRCGHTPWQTPASTAVCLSLCAERPYGFEKEDGEDEEQPFAMSFSVTMASLSTGFGVAMRPA